MPDQMLGSSLKILQTQSLARAIQDQILNLIVSGELDAGDKLIEMDLAARFGVSRGPIREALSGLEEAGLLTHSKNRGAFVREFSSKEVAELYELRGSYDYIAGELLAPKISDPQLAELSRQLAGMDVALAKRDFRDYFRRNIKFHDRIVEMTENGRFIDAYRRLVKEMLLIRRRVVEFGEGDSKANEEHRMIVGALQTRKPRVAGECMRKHVMNGERRLMSIARRPANIPRQ